MRGRRGAVLFVSAAPGDTFRYRCSHQAEQLGHLGVKAETALYGDVDLEELLDEYAAFVLHRVPYDEGLAGFLAAARHAGKHVLFDADDLVFDPAAEAPLGAVASEQRLGDECVAATIAGCRATLSGVDAATFSTEPLRARAASMIERSATTFNAVSDAMVAHAAEVATGERGASGDRVTIAYLSGTPTHQRDWAEAADGVLQTLAGRPFVHLLAVGYLELDDRFDPFLERIERLSFQRWQELPRLLAGVDVNLAPLESDDAFAECKSALKYLEAALVAVPTVASARPDFERVIRDGQTGFLARARPDWHPILERLVGSEELRRRVGDAARADVLAAHTTRARAFELRRTWVELLGGRRGGELVVNWLAPAGDARCATVLRLAQALAARGHLSRVYAPQQELKRVRRMGRRARNVQVLPVEEGLAPADVVVAAETPAATEALAGGAPCAVYLVDDAELTAAESGEAAAETLLLPLRHVCVTPDLEPRARAIARVEPAVLPPAPGAQLEAEALEAILVETCFVRAS